MLDAADASDRGTRLRVAMSQGGFGARGKFSDMLDALTVLLNERARSAAKRGNERQASGAARAVDVVEEAKELASRKREPAARRSLPPPPNRRTHVMTDKLTHVGESGEARMVDVSDKSETRRIARATGVIKMEPATLSAIVNAEIKKGDVLAVARIAGVMAAKRTADLIPLCHPLLLTDVQVVLSPNPAVPGVEAEATVTTTGRTGVEMEALTAVSVALLTVYDMAKALDRGMEISDISLASKSGGVRGDFSRVDRPG